jgi:phosphopantetheinyl transferase (holo-ACP synthase)
MPQLHFDFGDQNTLGAVSFHATWLPVGTSPLPIAQLQSRFPARDFASLPGFRLLEHSAVHLALAALGIDDEILHADNGAPRFAQQQDLELSISHSRHPELGIAAAVAISARESTHGRLGVDVEFPRDTLLLVAPRIFTEDEMKRATTMEAACGVWCLKEAAWKGWGPSLDYSEDIAFLSQVGQVGRFEAEVLGNRRQYVLGKATQKGLPWWSVVGPVN